MKEISEPAGALIYASQFQLGDPTLSILELWGAEYQESNAILLRPECKTLLEKIGQRERCPISFVGKITGDGKVGRQIGSIFQVLKWIRFLWFFGEGGAMQTGMVLRMS